MNSIFDRADRAIDVLITNGPERLSALAELGYPVPPDVDSTILTDERVTVVYHLDKGDDDYHVSFGYPL